ncbi:hypothetical protein M231_07533 [Tremella mesenterica]|uniref:Potassium channel domain-containing protein n=1 Tax=Tremella mesenterica TaxID=5217 RepID=A0A4V1M306_TREME|nr:uncharacterized protein TREMEDRAFT_59969 [Tremella mesenterica DSM 1558]EIW71024.1 hypothetical protein TREMEDRAFT_59969 [Tremella mesenterica DSM 1558]RXK35200.1 hypothetical protein M231_07533 [Tremella mesenterica]
MTSLAYLNAIHPDLAFHVNDDRPPPSSHATSSSSSSSRSSHSSHSNHTARSITSRPRSMDLEGGDVVETEDIRSEDAQEEDMEHLQDELENAKREDEKYDEEQRKSRRGSERRSIDYGITRTTSPIDIDNGRLQTKMPRTVTINEPFKSSTDQYPYTTSKEGSNYNRSNTWTTVTSLIPFIGEKRSDKEYQGILPTLVKWLFGHKETSGVENNEEDPDYVPPKYRWTPILSGLLQPFSILLEIPGLTEHWYVRTVDDHPVVYQSNPVILDVGLAISMACGVVANVALISRFLERRVYTSTVVTIVGLTLHDIINVVAITIFGVVHRTDDGFTYSEAFWLCVCSTAASMFTNATLVYDLIKTKDFRKSGSGLTAKQRSLVIIVMILLVYLALGALCFNFLIPEITFQDSLYFVVVSLETVGYGDITPSHVGAKIFLLFYAPIGILNLAVTVGTARDTMVESWNAAYRRRRHEMIKRHKIRKQQRQEENIRRVAIEQQLEAIGAPVYINRGGVRAAARGKRLNVKALSEDQLNAAETQAMEEIASKQSSASVHEASLLALGGSYGMTGGMGGNGNGTSVTKLALGPDLKAEGQTSEMESEGRQKALADAARLQEELTAQSLLSEEGYREFQERMAREERMENWIKFAFALAMFIIFWLVGATVFAATENWSYFLAFYFCFVTFTTIGYGEISPHTPAGRAFFIIWAILGVATVTLLIAVLTEAYANRYKSVVRHRDPGRTLDLVNHLVHPDPSHISLTSLPSDPIHSSGQSVPINRSNQNLTSDPSVQPPDPSHLTLTDPSQPSDPSHTSHPMHHSHLNPFHHPHPHPLEVSYQILSLVRQWHLIITAERLSAGHDLLSLPNNPLYQLREDLLRRLMDDQSLTQPQRRQVEEDEEAKKMLLWTGYEKAVAGVVSLAEESIKVHELREKGRKGLIRLSGPRLWGKHGEHFKSSKHSKLSVSPKSFQPYGSSTSPSPLGSTTHTEVGSSRLTKSIGLTRDEKGRLPIIEEKQ